MWSMDLTVTHRSMGRQTQRNFLHPPNTGTASQQQWVLDPVAEAFEYICMMFDEPSFMLI